MKLERDGVLDRKAMKLHLGVARISWVEKILEELFSEGMVEVIPEGLEDAGQVQLSLKGANYIGGGEEERVEVGVVQEDKTINDLERVFTGGDLTSLMIFISSLKSLTTTPLDHQIMRERFGLSATKLESMLEWLQNFGFLELVGENLHITTKGRVIADGKEVLVLEGEGIDSEGGIDDADDSLGQVETSNPEDTDFIRQDLENVLFYISENFSVRMTANSYGIMEKRLGISRTLMEAVVEELLRRDCLDSENGKLVVTTTGKKYVSGELLFDLDKVDENVGSLRQVLIEAEDSEKLDAAE